MPQADSLSLGQDAVPVGGWPALRIDESYWLPDRLAALTAELAAGASTAMMIVEAGQVVFEWGDVAHKSSIASVRKSLINILYGIYISEGRIDPASTLAELEIDDLQPLTPVERQATVMDLLMARSGVYLPSAYDTERGRPPRGSHKPGTHWFYNNWDFNVLATIVARQTGVSVFEGLASRLAAPLGMQDVAPGDGWFHYEPQSQHPVYKIRMSARDLARVGLLYLRRGRWGQTRIVPEEWVRDSTMPHAEVAEGHGYGYLWWSSVANAPGDRLSVDVPIFYASGAGGQYVIVLPSLDLVVVHRSAPSLRAGEGVSHERMGNLLRLAVSARPPRR